MLEWGLIKTWKSAKMWRHRKEAVLLKLCKFKLAIFVTERKVWFYTQCQNCSLGSSPYSRMLLICINQQIFLLEKCCFCLATQVAVFALDGSRWQTAWVGGGILARSPGEVQSNWKANRHMWLKDAQMQTAVGLLELWPHTQGSKMLEAVLGSPNPDICDLVKWRQNSLSRGSCTPVSYPLFQTNWGCSGNTRGLSPVWVGPLELCTRWDRIQIGLAQKGPPLGEWQGARLFSHSAFLSLHLSLGITSILLVCEKL